MTLQEFKDKYLGKQVEYHSFGTGALNQCIDLTNQYFVEVLGLSPIIGTNAKDAKDRFNAGEFEWIVNTPEAIIKKGDIPVWNGNVGGGAGHIAIALEDGTQNSFKSLDQNWSQTERVTLETHNYNNVSGWLRPKASGNIYKGLDLSNPDSMKVAVDMWDAVVNQKQYIAKAEYDRVAKLLTDNENTNRQKDEAINMLKTTVGELTHDLKMQEQETLEFVVRNEELIGERDKAIAAKDQLQLELKACETATDTPPTVIEIPPLSLCSELEAVINSKWSTWPLGANYWRKRLAELKALLPK